MLDFSESTAESGYRKLIFFFCLIRLCVVKTSVYESETICLYVFEIFFFSIIADVLRTGVKNFFRIRYRVFGDRFVSRVPFITFNTLTVS